MTTTATTTSVVAAGEQITAPDGRVYNLGIWGSQSRISVFSPWKTELRVSRITGGGLAQLTGYADSSNREHGFRWVRENNPRHHVDAMWLDNVTIYVAGSAERLEDETVWGTGTIAVYPTVRD
jgi:hypothetical protein